jgi:NADPH:quinone reductase-like Zn-dependent oxidoreductase
MVTMSHSLPAGVVEAGGHGVTTCCVGDRVAYGSGVAPGYFTRPTLASYAASREDLLESAARVFDLVVKGAITPRICYRYALLDAAAAHQDLESGGTSGSSILLP